MQPRVGSHIVLVVLLFALPALAQSSTDGAISGVVTDQQNAVITAATVTALDAETNAIGRTTTDATGRFRLHALPPGAYTIEIAALKFGARRVANITVEVGRVTNVDATLPTAPVVEAVTVN